MKFPKKETIKFNKVFVSEVNVIKSFSITVKHLKQRTVKDD